MVSKNSIRTFGVLTGLLGLYKAFDTNLDGVFGYLTLLIALATVAVGVGLLVMKKWSRNAVIMLGVLYIGIYLVLLAMSGLSNFNFEMGVIIAYYLTVLWYFKQSEIDDYFKEMS